MVKRVTVIETRTCINCNGTGMASADTECGTCSGSGTVGVQTIR